MRKLVIVGAIGVAAAAGYMLSQQGDQPVEQLLGKSATEQLLEVIPSDTVMFSGQLKPFPLKNYLKNTLYPQSQLPAELVYELEKDQHPQGLFLSSLLKSYFNAATSGEAFQALFGFEDEFVGAFYMVGALPVMRYKAGDPEAIWRLFDKAEQDSGLKHTLKKSGNLEYRSYQLSVKDDKPLELVVAVEGDWVTLTMDGKLISADDLKVALAQLPPEQSLQQSGKVEAIRAQHNFLPESIAYIDHQELVTALTSKEGNALAKMISKLLETSTKPQELDAIRTDACRQELGEIAASWPKTVIGMRDMQINSERSYIDASMIVESNNSTVMGALATMQGYLPAYLQEPQILGFGLGIDANRINPALSTIWSGALNAQYQCEPLQQMQVSLKEANPAALAMFTGMIQGVKGVGLTVKDFAINQSGPVPELSYLDAMVSLSADNPAVLFNMSKTFAPPLAGIELPTDGSAVDLSGFIPPGQNTAELQPMLALKGKHLVVYTGERSREVAEKLAMEEPVSNGVMSAAADYKRLLTPMVPLMQANAEPEIVEQLEVLKDLDMKLYMKLHFSDKGIELQTSADMKVMAEQGQ